MIRSLSFALALGLATSATAQEMTDAERATFRDEVRAYLLENPEVLMEAIGVLEQRDQANATANDIALVQSNAPALFDDGFSWVGGNPDGDITIVEFMDYRCGYCKRAFPEVAELLTTDGNIRYIVKEFPILGEQSELAARFAIAVKLIAGDDAYETAHNTLMEFRGDITPDSLGRLAQTLALDANAITAKMTAPEVTAVIANNRRLGEIMQISGTPSFVFDDTMVRGYVPLEQMKQIVAAVRAN